MNWSFKFAFDEMKEMFNNRPWLLVDDKLETKQNNPDEQGESFVSMQKQLMLERGWEWFSKVVRGRFFPNLNLTTLTTIEGEKHPEIGEPAEAVQRVREKFPGAALVSLIGGAHVIEGTGYVSPEILSALTKQACEQKWHQGFEKTAMLKIADDEESRPYYKDEFHFEISDVDRYTTDKYIADLALQETVDKYSVGFQMYNYQVGITGAVQYWHYNKDEFERAKKTFKEAKKALREVMMDLEYYRPPMAIITPMIRAALHSIDLPKKERSGNYFFNWFKELPKEADWRTTLYGNRYPPSIIQSIDVTWNKDEHSKQITIEGGSGRSRVLRYKPSPNTKLAMNSKDLEKIIMSAWGVGAAGLAGWLLGLGISGQQIQQIQQGASPQDIIRQVAPQNINGQAPEINFQPENPAPVSETPEISGSPLDMSPNIDNMQDDVPQVVDLPSLIDRLIQTESSGDPQATSPRGARGLMQIMQPTWEEWSANVFGKELPFDKAYDPDLNQQVGTAYLKWIQETLRIWMDREPGVEHILSAYNGGIGRLRRLGFDVSKMPSESRNYVNKIIGQKQGSNQTYHYAYQGTEWLKWKSQAIQWAKEGWDQTQIGQALAQNGASNDAIRKLIGEVVTPFLASAYAKSNWDYKYVSVTAEG